MHRVIINAPKHLLVDHINHSGLDNRKANLRTATCAQNNVNRASYKTKNSPSKYKGVYWSKRDKKWQVQICYNYKCRTIGLFDNEFQAAKAYDEAAKKYHKEFAVLNLPHLSKESTYKIPQTHCIRALHNSKNKFIEHFKEEIKAAKNYDKN